MESTTSGKPDPFFSQKNLSPTLISADHKTNPTPSQLAAVNSLPSYNRSSKTTPTIEELRKQEKKYKDNLLDHSFMDQSTFSRLTVIKNDVSGFDFQYFALY